MKKIYKIQNYKNYQKVMALFDKYGYQFNALSKIEETYDGEIYLAVDFVQKKYSRRLSSSKVEFNGMELCADIDQYEEEMNFLLHYVDDYLLQQVCNEIDDINQWDRESLLHLNQCLCSDRQLLYDIWKEQSRGILTAIQYALNNWLEEHDFEYFKIKQYDFCMDGVE